MYSPSSRKVWVILTSLTFQAMIAPDARSQRFRPRTPTMTRNPSVLMQTPSFGFGFSANRPPNNFGAAYAAPFGNAFMNPLAIPGNLSLRAGLGAYGSPPARVGGLKYGPMYANPYLGGYGAAGYGAGSSDPFAGYLRGGADVINAQAGFVRNQCQARPVPGGDGALPADFDQGGGNDSYEPAPALAPVRDPYGPASAQALGSGTVPRAQILSGAALNDLLHTLGRRNSIPGQEDRQDLRLPLDENGLRQINVSRGPGSMGVLKDGELTWPAALEGAAFESGRQELAALVARVVARLKAGRPVEPATRRKMTAAAARMYRQLRDDLPNIPMPSYVEARHFCQALEDAIRALGAADAVNHFNGAYTLSVATVPDLVAFMTRKGLHFAPAVAGDEAAYEELYKALTTYEQNAPTRTARR